MCGPTFVWLNLNYLVTLRLIIMSGVFFVFVFVSLILIMTLHESLQQDGMLHQLNVGLSVLCKNSQQALFTNQVIMIMNWSTIIKTKFSNTINEATWRLLEQFEIERNIFGTKIIRVIFAFLEKNFLFNFLGSKFSAHILPNPLKCHVLCDFLIQYVFSREYSEFLEWIHTLSLRLWETLVIRTI